jgi:hypothetical protein
VIFVWRKQITSQGTQQVLQKNRARRSDEPVGYVRF